MINYKDSKCTGLACPDNKVINMLHCVHFSKLHTFLCFLNFNIGLT